MVSWSWFSCASGALFLFTPFPWTHSLSLPLSLPLGSPGQEAGGIIWLRRSQSPNNSFRKAVCGLLPVPDRSSGFLAVPVIELRLALLQFCPLQSWNSTTVFSLFSNTLPLFYDFFFFGLVSSSLVSSVQFSFLPVFFPVVHCDTSTFPSCVKCVFSGFHSASELARYRFLKNFFF